MFPSIELVSFPFYSIFNRCYRQYERVYCVSFHQFICVNALYRSGRHHTINLGDTEVVLLIGHEAAIAGLICVADLWPPSTDRGFGNQVKWIILSTYATLSALWLPSRRSLALGRLQMTLIDEPVMSSSYFQPTQTRSATSASALDIV